MLLSTFSIQMMILDTRIRVLLSETMLIVSLLDAQNVVYIFLRKICRHSLFESYPKKTLKCKKRAGWVLIQMTPFDCQTLSATYSNAFI